MYCENIIGAATVERVWRLLKKLKIELPYDTAIPLLGIYLKKMEKKNPTNSERHMHPKSIAALFTIAKTWKQPKCRLMDKWIKKMWCIYIYTHTHTHTHIHIHTMEYYLAIKKNESCHL